MYICIYITYIYKKKIDIHMYTLLGAPGKLRVLALQLLRVLNFQLLV